VHAQKIAYSTKHNTCKNLPKKLVHNNKYLHTEENYRLVEAPLISATIEYNDHNKSSANENKVYAMMSRRYSRNRSEAAEVSKSTETWPG